MEAGATTKDRLLGAGLEMMHTYGYRATGIQGVLSSVDVPKGSFYNYFKSKQEFGLAVLDSYIEFQGKIGAPSLMDLSRPPLQRLRGFFEAFIEYYREKPRAGCMLGNFAQELSDEEPVFREKLSHVFQAWIESIEACLREAQDKDQLAKKHDPKLLAEFCVCGWQGALMRMKLQQSIDPLESFVTVLFAATLKS